MYREEQAREPPQVTILLRDTKTYRCVLRNFPLVPYMDHLLVCSHTVTILPFTGYVICVIRFPLPVFHARQLIALVAGFGPQGHSTRLQTFPVTGEKNGGRRDGKRMGHGDSESHTPWYIHV